MSNVRTDNNESTSQPMIRTYSSVSLKGKDLYEGRLQLYSFIQQDFLHENKIIRNEPNDDASNSSRDATQQDVQKFKRKDYARPEGVGGVDGAGGPDSYINTRIGKGTGISLLTNASQRLGRAGVPYILVSAGGAYEDTSSFSTSSLGLGRAGNPGSLVSAGVADEETNSFPTSSLGIGRAGSPGSFVSAGGADKDTSSFSNSSLGIGMAGSPGSVVSTRCLDKDSSSFHTSSLGIGRAGSPGSLVNAEGAGENASSVSTDKS